MPLKFGAFSTFAVSATALAHSSNINDENGLKTMFMTFLAHHGKAYATVEEFEHRFNLYAQVDLEIKQFNSVPQTSTVGHNKYSDWTQEERKRLTSNLGQLKKNTNLTATILETNDLPSEVNWVKAGAVNAVQD